MSTYALPVLYTLLVWWVSTGLVLGVLGFAAARPKTAGAVALVVLAASLGALAATAADTSLPGLYVAFTAAILVWGVQELAFLAGWITGPWRRESPAGAGALARTGYAVGAILYHELALLASGLAILAATWGGASQAAASHAAASHAAASQAGANTVGIWTFAILFGMRVSAKLNVFLGVPNLTEGFLPRHLAYLTSFFAKKPMNPLFPVSVTVSTAVLVVLAGRAAAADGPAAVAVTLAATLVGLGLLEHWFLVLPLPVEAMWRWYLGARPEAGTRAAARDPAGEDAGRGPAATVIQLRPQRAALAADRLATGSLAYPGRAGAHKSDICAVVGSE